MRNPTLFDVVSEVCARFGLRPVSVVPVVAGFSGAQVFRIHADDGREYAVRRSPPLEQIQVRRIHQLHQLLQCLVHQGLTQVSVPLALPPNADAELRHDTILSDKSGHWQIEPWMPGVALGSGELTSSHVDSAVRLIHQWHILAGAFAAAQPQDRPLRRTNAPSPAVGRRLALVSSLDKLMLHNWREAARADLYKEFGQLALAAVDLAARQRPALLASLSRISSHPFPLQPVIRDLHSAHVLFSGEQVTGLIDLNACATDHVCNDLVRLGRSWFGADNRRYREFIGSYHALHPLDADAWKLLRALDTCCVCLNPLVWLQRRYDNGQTTQTQQPQVIDRLRELVATAGQFEPV